MTDVKCESISEEGPINDQISNWSLSKVSDREVEGGASTALVVLASPQSVGGQSYVKLSYSSRGLREGSVSWPSRPGLSGHYHIIRRLELLTIYSQVAQAASPEKMMSLKVFAPAGFVLFPSTHKISYYCSVRLRVTSKRSTFLRSLRSSSPERRCLLSTSW